jgi:superfamily I DNA/RNA helicase
LNDIAQSIERMADYCGLHSTLSESQIDAITKLLAPTAHIRPLLRDEIGDVNLLLLELTDRQKGVLATLRRNRRVVVYGSAGTGKTILAIEHARRLAAEGFRVLLTCYNQPLGRYLEREFRQGERITAGHFHGLCRTLAAGAGLSVSGGAGREWYDQEMPEILLEAARKTGRKWDALIVDEGQDFAPDWWMVLQLLLEDPEESPFYVFVDTRQNIYRDSWAPPFDETVCDLDMNCRSTRQIAYRVAAIFGEAGEALGADGPQPEFLTVSGPEEVERQLRGVLQRILHEGAVEARRVIVLADRRQLVERLAGRELAGHVLIRAAEAEQLELSGKPSVRIETIHRFKGLEADVVIVILTKVERERERALAYVGMSRARVKLVVIGSDETRKKLLWAGGPT